jgi:hypothetical protein
MGIQTRQAFRSCTAGRTADGGSTPGSHERTDPMVITAPRPPTATTATAAEPRLRMNDSAVRASALDGAWWPRTADPVRELPALVEALAGRRGVVTYLLLNVTEWDLPHPRRVTAGGRSVRLGWFTAQPAGLLTAICDFHRDRLDLLIVPATATPADAATAMDAAADPKNIRRAPALLADLRRAT